MVTIIYYFLHKHVITLFIRWEAKEETMTKVFSSFKAMHSLFYTGEVVKLCEYLISMQSQNLLTNEIIWQML